MAKESKVVTLNVSGIGTDAVTAGSCVMKIVEAGKNKQLVSLELKQHVVVIRSDLESTEELASWASHLESELRSLVGGIKPPAQASLPRSAEG
jgi:hypothetical protein